MLTKILKNDLLRKKSITIALFIFIMLSALLVSSGSRMIIELFNSLEQLFAQSAAPHFVQMHAGEINQSEIDRWTSNNRLVQNQQTVKMVNIDGSNLYIGNSVKAEKNSVMDISFVRQNKEFDYLLDLNNQVIHVSKGEIGVPIFFMERDHLQIGDKIRVSNGTFNQDFTIAYFVRDALMNPSIVHSKRFVVNEDDFKILEKNFSEIEYLIEFQLSDVNKLNEFSNAYQSSGLPEKGPTIDYNTFKILNALTDSIVAGVIILVSMLLIIIALLSLRFTILATLEEDYREIGVMKAIGIEPRYIRRLYLVKYIFMSALACISGYMISIFFSHLFTKNMMLYIGSASNNILQHFIPFLATCVIFLIVVFFCSLTLRRFNKITAVEALRAGSIGETKTGKNYFSLAKSKYLDANVFLGLRDTLGRLKMFRLLFFVFVVSSFIIIVPVNFLNTIQSPDFISYMGIGKSDIRIDLQQSDDIVQRFEQVRTYIKNDGDVERYSSLITSRLQVVNSDGVLENINVETGDFSVFPLEYLEGGAPTKENEIALSYLNGKELQKSVGDKVLLMIKGQEKEMVVSGIYQDITNGGRTAKALLSVDHESVLWYVISLDVKPDVPVDEKIDEYSKIFHPAKVTHLQGYLAQTLGDTVEQLKMITILAIVIAVFVSILITSLFLKMLVAKDLSQIAIMKSIGFSLRNIQMQYVIRVLLVLTIGILVGTVISNTMGQSLVSALWSLMGASKINFVIDPVKAYILCPLMLMFSVTVITLISTASIRETSISRMIAD